MTFVKYETGTKHVSKDKETSDDPNAFTDCGRLIEDDEIVVDIDNLPKKSIKAMLDTFQIETEVVWTDRGAHLWFKKPENKKKFQKDGVCRLAFKAEYKTSTNSPNGVTVKRNGVMREIENEGKRDPFPFILNYSSKYKDLTGMEDGDGRNNALFAHKKIIRDSDDWLRVLQFINNHVFATPIDDKEFYSTIASTESTSGIVEDGTPEYKIAMRIMKDRKCVKWTGSIWYKDDEDEFKCDPDYFHRLVCKYAPGAATKRIDEIEKQILYNCDLKPSDYVFKVNLLNGCLYDGKFIPIRTEEFTPYSIDLEYDENAQPLKIVDDYLYRLADANPEKYSDQDREDYKNLILESMAFGLITDHVMTRDLCRFFIYRGDGGNGKGTLLSIIRRILGTKNCSAMSISQLGDEKYLPSLIGKLANLGDDIEPKPITTSQFKNIKNITSGDDVEIRRLYKQAETAKLPVKLIFTSNKDIRTFDKGDALKRRMCWMPMFNGVTKGVTGFLHKVTTPDALRYWIKLAVEAYMRLYENGWTESKIAQDYNDNYHMHNDLMELFVREIDFSEMHYKTMSEIKEIFRDWNTEDDQRGFSPTNFKEALWKIRKAGFAKSRPPGTKNNPAMIILQTDETSQNLKPEFK